MHMMFKSIVNLFISSVERSFEIEWLHLFKFENMLLSYIHLIINFYETFGKRNII